MSRAFRFGVQLSALAPDDWMARVRQIEAWGYSTIFWPDHFGPQWDPTAALSAIAAACERIHVGTLVYDVDFRHPIVFAKAAATIHLLSGGRHEFGLGAGWMQSDYDQSGIPYDRPGVRISRLEEALQIIESMWLHESTSFSGKHYQVTEVPRAAPLPAGERPRILIGGGGPRLLGLAGRRADIVGINPSMHEGRITNATAADLAPDRVREKIGWVREAASAAGRPDHAIEFNSLVFVVAMTDDPKSIRAALAKSSGMSEDEVANCPLFLTGSASEIQDRLVARREETGISYICVQGRDTEMLARFADQVVAPLSNS